jgi:DNA-binding Xre family transcriptional regulator
LLRERGDALPDFWVGHHRFDHLGAPHVRRHARQQQLLRAGVGHQRLHHLEHGRGRRLAALLLRAICAAVAAESAALLQLQLRLPCPAGVRARSGGACCRGGELRAPACR